MIVSILVAIAVVSVWMLALAGINRLGLVGLAYQDRETWRTTMSVLTQEAPSSQDRIPADSTGPAPAAR